jgi:hypothetical protein
VTACDSGAAGAVPPIERMLALRNRYGSVEHYYHFILGFVAPLLVRAPAVPPGTIRLIRSCGPMDAHLLALGLPDIRILPRPDWEACWADGTRNAEGAQGFDSPEFYDQAVFRRLREAVLQRLGLERVAPVETVLLINRGRSPDFYQSDQAESRSSADLRRTVPNMAAVCAAVAAGLRPARMVELETASLRDQVALFAASRLVVAQHGAALTNMLWMAPGAAIVEINPMLPGTKFVDYFRDMAQVCGHRYRCVRQAQPHAPVDPADVLAAIGAVAADA